MSELNIEGIVIDSGHEGIDLTQNKRNGYKVSKYKNKGTLIEKYLFW